MLLVISRSRLDAFHALAAKLQVSQRVIFAGPCEEMAAAYHASDLFVYPSAYDAFGMVVAEAMACGLPVIAGRTIGAAEWIDEGRNGLLCDAGSPDSFQRQIARAEANPDSASQMGDRARETAQGHSWEACADAVWNVYERAANKTP
jgi:UDP-glucose:(heptosyl)LPS alpha-1,3-glucosyltransferase